MYLYGIEISISSLYIAAEAVNNLTFLELKNKKKQIRKTRKNIKNYTEEFENLKSKSERFEKEKKVSLTE